MPSYIGKELSIGAKIAALEIEKEINNLNIKDLSELKLLNPLLEELSKITESQIMITDINGKILITFPKQKSQKTQLISESDIKEALMKEYNIKWIRSPERAFRVIVPLTIDNEKKASLQLYRPIRISKRRYAFSWVFLLIAAIILILLPFPISRGITKPIKQLSEASKKIAKGELGYQTKVRSSGEIGRLADSFNYMSRTLAELNNARRELIADISHELRSPLSRIQTDAEILLDRDLLKEKRDLHLKAICEEVKHLDHLIGDLFEISKMELKKAELNFEPAKLQDIVNSEIAKISSTLKEKVISIETNISQTIPIIKIDKRRISQVIGNLLSNALRYTPEGGKIIIGSKENGDFVEIFVEDNGIGISKEELPKIFERFYRVDKSRTRETGGTGLGLAIAKQIVEAHGGKIFAESELNSGTTITFTLPLQK